MNVFLCGLWDGSHLWLQWEGAGEPPNNFELRLSFRSEGGEWEVWGPIMNVERSWLAFNTQRPAGTSVRARVRPAGTEEWVDAVEVRFIRSRCRFQFSSQQKRVYYEEGTVFNRHVDGAVCSYRSTGEIEVSAGETIEAELEAVTSGPWSQLDQPGDFLLRPAIGVRISNIEESQEDIEPTGRDFTVLKLERDGPVTMAFLDTPIVR